MMRILKEQIKRIIYLLLFILLSFCKKKNDTFLIVDKNFESILDKKIIFFDSINMHYKRNNKEILIEYIFSENMKDTSLRIINTKPYTCERIKGYHEYKGYRLFLYTTLDDKHISKIFKIHSQYKNCKDFVKPRPFDSGIEYFLKIKNGHVVR